MSNAAKTDKTSEPKIVFEEPTWHDISMTTNTLDQLIILISLWQWKLANVSLWLGHILAWSRCGSLGQFMTHLKRNSHELPGLEPLSNLVSYTSSK